MLTVGLQTPEIDHMQRCRQWPARDARNRPQAAGSAVVGAAVALTRRRQQGAWRWPPEHSVRGGGGPWEPQEPSRPPIINGHPVAGYSRFFCAWRWWGVLLLVRCFRLRWKMPPVLLPVGLGRGLCPMDRTSILEDGID